MKFLKFEEVEIDKIKSDPNQPRQKIDELDLKEMSESIGSTGIINPPEVDEDLKIITGELRVRAAKMAGLKTIQVKVIEIEEDERFIRQVVENIHRNTLSDMDTAEALKRMLSMSPGGKHAKTPLTGPTADKGKTWLAAKIGKSRAYVDDKLALLEAPKFFKEAVKNEEVPGTFARALNKTPEKYKSAVEEKILKKELKTTSVAMDLAKAIKKEEDDPSTIDKLLKTDYSKYKSGEEVKEAIEKISPSVQKKFTASKSYKRSGEINEIHDNLKEWVSNNPASKMAGAPLIKMTVSMKEIKTLVEEWLEESEKCR